MLSARFLDVFEAIRAPIWIVRAIWHWGLGLGLLVVLAVGLVFAGIEVWRRMDDEAD